MATKRQARRPTATTRSFRQELVLNRWMLGFFRCGTFGALTPYPVMTRTSRQR